MRIGVFILMISIIFGACDTPTRDINSADKSFETPPEDTTIQVKEVQQKVELKDDWDSTVYKSLESALVNPDSVFVLQLPKKNDLSPVSFPKDIFRLKNLRVLILNLNRIEELPEEIGTLSNLQYLDVGSNYLMSLPTTIGNLKELRYLKVEDNMGLDSLPKELYSLMNLQSFSASLCSFQEFPKGLCQLNELEYLDLSKTQLTEIPGCISNLRCSR